MYQSKQSKKKSFNLEGLKIDKTKTSQKYRNKWDKTSSINYVTKKGEKGCSEFVLQKRFFQLMNDPKELRDIQVTKNWLGWLKVIMKTMFFLKEIS